MSDSRLPSLNGLRAFAVAARSGSLVRAAETLGVTPGAVSRLIRQLEADLGTGLYRRTARGIELTEAGAAYAVPLADAFDRIGAATRLVRRRHEHRLALSLMPTFAMRWLMPRLHRFQAAHPGITAEVTVSERPVDFAAEPIDLAVRLGLGNWPGAAAERLMGETVALVASPALLAGRPVTVPADILGHTLLVHSTRPQAWTEWFGAAGLDPALIRPGPAFEHFFLSIAAAESGMGLALVPRLFIADELARGRLVEPLAIAVERAESYWIGHAPGRERDPVIATFKTWLRAEASSG
ncbi:MAG: LysR family transcriptional regulator [Alphaproteobacteria bacterium]|jgi:LysR family glycine cleavage system transcriptional activator|nr:LysR family transcriptional regulator [Alphaproteobacteria bacterium]